jgi:tetratricopeptide (TPR) repeat protein
MPQGQPRLYRAIGCALLGAAFLGAQAPQPRPAKPVYLIAFQGAAQPGGWGDLPAFATTTLRLRLSGLKSLQYLSSQAETPCRQSRLEGFRSPKEGVGDWAAVPKHYLVSGSVDVRYQEGGVAEIDLSYSLDEVERCQLKNLLQSRAPMAPAGALARFRSMGDMVALRLEEELSDRMPVIVEPVATSSSDEQTRNAAQLLKQLLERGLADSDDFRAASDPASQARAHYRLIPHLETKPAPEGRRIESLRFRIETGSKGYDLPVESAPADQGRGAVLEFLGDAADSALRALAEIRYRSESGLPDDPAQVETSLVVAKAENYLRQGQPRAVLALFSGLPANRPLPAEALALKGRALFDTDDFPAAARVYDGAVAAARNAAPLVQARMLYGAGAAWYRAREYSNAAERYARLLPIARKAGEPAAEVKTMVRESARWRIASLGLAGNPEQALEEYLKLRPLVDDPSGLDDEAQRLLAGISSISSLRRMTELLAARLGPDSPVLQRSWQRLGDGLFATRDFEKARQCYQNALSAAQKRVPPDEPQLALLSNWVGNTYLNSSMPLKAIPYYETAIKKASAGGESHAGEQVVYLRNLAVAHEVSGAPDKAETALKDAKRTVETTSGAGSPQAAVVDVQLGSLYTSWGKHSEADPLLSHAVAVLEKQSPRNDQNLVRAYGELGWLRWEMRKVLDAEDLFRKALAILDARGETSSTAYGDLLASLAAAYGLKGDYAQAVSTKKRAFEISTRSESPAAVAVHTFNLCSSLNDLQWYSEAASHCEKAQRAFQRLYGAEHWMSAYASLELADIRGAQAMFLAADELHAEGYRVYSASPARSTWRLLGARRALGRLRYREGRYAEAQGVLEETLQAEIKELGSRDSRGAETQDLLGWTLFRLGDPQARAAFQAAIESFEARGLPDHPTASSGREGLGRLALASGNPANAEALCSRSLGARLKSFGYDSEAVADSLDCLGLVSTARGAYPVAAAHFQRGLAAYEKTFGPQHPKIAETLDHFAALRKATGDTAESARLADRAAAIRAAFGLVARQ